MQCKHLFQALSISKLPNSSFMVIKTHVRMKERIPNIHIGNYVRRIVFQTNISQAYSNEVIGNHNKSTTHRVARDTV